MHVLWFFQAWGWTRSWRQWKIDSGLPQHWHKFCWLILSRQFQKIFVMRTKCKSMIIKLGWEFHNSYAKFRISSVNLYLGFKFLCIVCMVCVYASWGSTMVHVERSEDGFMESVLSFHLYKASGDRTQATRLIQQKCLYPLINLAIPPSFNGKCWSLEIRKDAFVTQRLVANSSSQLKAEALIRRNSAFHFLSYHRQCDILEHIPLMAKAIPMATTAILVHAVLLSVCWHAALILSFWC